MSIDVNDITLGQLKELREVLNIAQPMVTNDENKFVNPLIGKWVIVRTYASGVHFGYLQQHSNQNVELRNARRIWRYYNKSGGISLSDLALEGLDLDKDSRVCAVVETHIITDAIEIIKTSHGVINQLKEVETYNANS